MKLTEAASALVRLLLRRIHSGENGSSTYKDAQDTKLELSEIGIQTVEPRQRCKQIKWSEIETVLWREPDYGYLGGLPYWVISGAGTTIEIEDWRGVGEQELPSWFARKLPGFEPNVVNAAFERGHFRAPEHHELECWTRGTVARRWEVPSHSRQGDAMNAPAHVMAAPPDAEFFRALEIERTNALVARDIAAIHRLHAPDYELISAPGRVISLERYLSLMAMDVFYAKWEHGPMKVQLSESMAAVRYQADITFPSGKVVHCWHTDIYALQSGTWRAVWSQATPLPPDSASSAAKQ